MNWENHSIYRMLLFVFKSFIDNIEYQLCHNGVGIEDHNTVSFCIKSLKKAAQLPIYSSATIWIVNQVNRYKKFVYKLLSSLFVI